MGEEIRQFYIYALLQDEKIFYIGQTDQAPIDRLYGHVGQARFRQQRGLRLNNLQAYLLELDEYPEIEILYEFKGYQWQADEVEKLYISSLIRHYGLLNTHHVKYPTSICFLTQAKIFMSLSTDRDKYARLCAKRASRKLFIPYKRIFHEGVSGE